MVRELPDRLVAPNFDLSQTFPPSRRPPRTWRRRWRLGIALLLGVAWLGVSRSLLLDAISRPPELPVHWTSTDPTPPPERFCFVLFPPSGGVPLLDKPGGASIARVTRAIYSTPMELAGDFAPVTDAGVSGFVLLAEFRPHAPPAEAETMIAALNREYAQRRPVVDDPLQWHVKLPKGGQGEVVTEVWSAGIERSTYTIGSGPPRPVRFEAAHEGAVGIEGAVHLFMALLKSAILFVVAGALSLYLLIRR